MTLKGFIFFLFLISIIASPLISQQDNVNQIQIQDESELIILDEETPAFFPEDGLLERDLGFFTAWDVIRMILILVFVIACIYGLFFVLKKAGVQKFKEDNLINIISSRSLATGKTMHIVEVGNHIMVIGAADNSISTLFEVTDKETIDNIRLQKAEIKKPAENSFQQYLYNMFFRGKGNKSFKEGSGFDFFKKQRDRIEKM
ncbi:MAG: flagellar biosynthetic protein FliO [Spirochaetaceae bacterium]|nr:flagellar biosynthetic protein FliO [Spirochaetaceae bacterium]